MKTLDMKRQLFLSLALVLCTATFSSLDAQTYQSAIGARLGYPLSISYKTFVAGQNAIEVYAGWRGYTYYRWFSVNAAYQIHNDLPGVDNLQWYYGAGAGAYFWNYDTGFADAGSNTSFALQGYLGLDYKVETLPINLTLDWIPTIFLNGYGNGFGGRYGSFGIRYVLGE